MSRFSNIAFHLGIDANRIRNVGRMKRYFKDLFAYRQLDNRPNFNVNRAELIPIHYDYDQSAGDAKDHYFYQDLWAARKIYRERPSRRVDIGSRVNGFIAHVLVFMDVELVDIRPLDTCEKGISVICDDATHLERF